MTDLPAPQLSRDDLAALTKAKRYAEIDQAREDGRLEAVMAGRDVTTSGLTKPDQLTRAELNALRRAGRNDEITEAHNAGRLADVLNPPPAA